MPDQTLGIILSASAQNAAAYDQMIAKNQELKSSSSDLNVIYGAQGQVLADLTQTMGANADSHQKVAAGAHGAAEAERDLTKEGSEAAKAMGELGAQGSEVFERFSSLAGMMGSGGELGIALGGALVGFGALIEGSKAISETYQEQQASIDSLRQASDATHQSFEDLNKSFESFADQNAQFIPNINQARDDLAQFTRAGFDAKTAMEAENVTVDLAATKHEDLATAGNQVLQMMEGQGKVAKQLGIDISALKASDDNAVAAHKSLETATKDVATAQDKLTSALRAQKEEQDALHGKKVISQHDLDVEQDKAAAVKTAQQNLTNALKAQKTAQDASNNSMQTSQQVLDQLSVKLDKGRQNYTDLEKQQNTNAAAWDDFVSRSGPAVNGMFLVIEGTLNGLIELLDDAAKAIQWIGANAGSALPGPGTSQVVAGRTAQYQGGGGGGAPATGGGGAGGGLASGGPAVPGGVYTVGEQGPETLVMGAAGGYVLPSGPGGGSGMDDTNELLAQAVALLEAIAGNTRGSTFTVGAWNPV